jgi:hypothetical protein
MTMLWRDWGKMRMVLARAMARKQTAGMRRLFCMISALDRLDKGGWCESRY